MILETTYTDKDVTLTINQTVGGPFTFLQRIRMGGIGSHRIMIKSVSKGLKQYINPGHSSNFTNIELRPRGILFHLKFRTQSYAWIIPFEDLDVSGDFAKWSDSEHSLLFQNPALNNHSFFKKVIDYSRTA